ncbi:MAG: hypothetical protein MUF72_04315 [Elainella sp. Prado103]|jgi:hypothetical protein|nr:hypothetical protein [Elainella sp. Prado103]
MKRYPVKLVLLGLVVAGWIGMGGVMGMVGMVGAQTPVPTPIPVPIPTLAPSPGLSEPLPQSDTVQQIKIGGDTIVNPGQVVEQAVAIRGNVMVKSNGYVTDQAVAIGGNITLEPNARVDGDVVAIGGQIMRDPTARLGGQEIAVFPALQGILNRFGVFGTLYLVNAMIYWTMLIFTVIVGIFLALLLPRHLQRMGTILRQNSFQSGVWGVGGFLATLLVSTLLSGSLLGMLVIPVVNLLLLIAGLVGGVVTAIWLGDKALSRSPLPFAAENSLSQPPPQPLIQRLLLGMLFLAILSLIPIVGGLLLAILNLFGFGAVLQSRFGSRLAHRVESPVG